MFPNTKDWKINDVLSNQKFGGGGGEFGKSEEEDLRIGESPINE